MHLDAVNILLYRQMPSGTVIETTNDVPYKPAPGRAGPCEDPECRDVCVIKTCEDKNEFQLNSKNWWCSIEHLLHLVPLRIQNVNDQVCDCPNISEQAHDIAEIKDGFMVTSFTTGHIYLSYQGAMEDASGNLLVLRPSIL